MRLKANDTLHVSSVKADNILPGEEFEVADDSGQKLVDKGLATEVKVARAKAEPAAPANKAEQPPANKTATPRSAK